MSLWTPCPFCGDPVAATDHDKGCPQERSLSWAHDQVMALPSKSVIALVDEFESWRKTWDGDDLLVRRADVLALLSCHEVK